MSLPNPPRRHWLRHGLATAAAACSAWPVRAQTPSAAATQIIYGFSAGGVATAVGELLARQWPGAAGGERAVFRHLPGAGGRQAHELVKAAAPDGRSLLYVSSSSLTLMPLVYRKLGYDLEDYTPVAPLYEFARSFTVGSAVPAEVKTLDDYAAWLQKNPGQGNYGVPALGSAAHMAGLLVGQAKGLSLRPVAYRGSASLIKDLQTGGLPAGLTIVGQNLDDFASGRLRSLGVASESRWHSLPQVPTLQEQGVSQAAIREWHGLMAPRGLSAELNERLNATVRRIVGAPSLQALAERASVRFLDQGVDQFAHYVQSDRAQWAEVVKLTRFNAAE